MVKFRLAIASLTLSFVAQAGSQSARNSCMNTQRGANSQSLEARLWNNLAFPMAGSSATMPGVQGDQPMPHEMDFPYYSLRPGFSSVLHLVSQSPSPITYTLVIHSLDGREMRLNPDSLAPHDAIAIDLSKLLVNADEDFAEGSISVSYEGRGPMPVVGQVTTQNAEKHLVYESRMVENDPGMGGLPSELHGMWWGLGDGREATVAVTNTANESASAGITVELKGKRYQGSRLEFRPYETRLLSVRDLLSEAHIPQSEASEGGVTITFLGPNPAMPSLIAQGRVVDRASGFSTTLNFLSADNLVSNVFDASGVPIGMPSADSPYANMGSFVPHVILRNLADIPQEVTLTLTFPATSGSQQRSLRPITVDRYSTKDIALSDFFGELPLPLPYASIRIQHSGVAGTLTAEVSSVEQMGDLVVDNHLANEADRMFTNSGINPWHLDNETDSMLFLTNTGGDLAKVLVRVNASSVEYVLNDVELKPYETVAVDLKAWRRAQQKDRNGNVIPLQTGDGSIHWSRFRGSSTIVGRTLVISRTRGVSSNFSCGTDCCNGGMAYLETDLYLWCDTMTVRGTCQFMCGICGRIAMETLTAQAVLIPAGLGPLVIRR
jgi:hypothetical protein